MRSTMRWGAIVAVALAAGACTFGREYRYAPIDPRKIADVIPGRTSRGEVLELFGPPHEVVGAPRVSVSRRRTAEYEARRGDRLLGLDVGEDTEVEAVYESNAGLDYLGAQGFRYRYVRRNTFNNFLLLLIWHEVDIKYDELLVLFDDADRVQHVAYRADTPRLRSAGFWFGEGDPDD